MNNYIYPPYPPYFYNPYFYGNRQYQNNKTNNTNNTNVNNNTTTKNNQSNNSTYNIEEKNQKGENKETTSTDLNSNSRLFSFNTTDYINIFGIELYMDDLLILALLVFLYLENVTDILLFCSLILILMS